ncbi:MAG: transcriptional regulator [Chloroflexus sp.]|uniref:ArsR/SmtB family transcription factor n=1 Tax=Chloroflexus sp. TaxID=1904827 RepID=UPI0021DE702F|nr:metalloregulator ArsR/SmtB family transcription factor [Chloroflexus sp.]GIV89810.1 MAG: transcriptional regulator [Chloroflexus sp.]
MRNTTATKQAHLFKALMHPVRIQIIEILRRGESCVCHIEAILGLRQAYVSQQLAVLRKAGLIGDRRDGPNIYYRLLRREVLDLLDMARAMIDESEPWQPIPVGCVCPQCQTKVSVSEKEVKQWST